VKIDLVLNATTRAQQQKQEATVLERSPAIKPPLTAFTPVTDSPETEETPAEDGEEDEEDLDLRITQAYLEDATMKALYDAVVQGDRTFRHSDFKVSIADVEAKEDRLYYYGKLLIPDNPDLRTAILRLHHDSPVAGHPGRSETYRLLARSYFWPGMIADSARYVRNCMVCSRTKTSRSATHGLLRPMPIPSGRWQELSIDFVTGVPPSGPLRYDNIMTVTDRLTKRRHFIPCHETIDARGAAMLYIQHVYTHHGLSDYITTDRGVQFTAEFWKHVCRRLGIQSRMSTAYHPETDGQSENSNAVMETYLRAYVNYLQDDWSTWLGLAEFTANNWTSESTGLTPFFADTGHHPKTGLEPKAPLPEHNSRRLRLEDVAAEELVDRLAEIENTLKANLTEAQARQEHYANQKRIPHPAYRPGDKVWLKSTNLYTNRPSKKLDWKNLGPFIITEKINNSSYRLKLPASMKVHPVFHSSLLRLAAEDPLPGQTMEPAPPVVIDEEEEYEVRQILDSRLQRKKLQYLVQWVGYDQPDWEPAENVVHAQSLVNSFHAQYPDKPGPISNAQTSAVAANAAIFNSESEQSEDLAGARTKGGVMSQSKACSMSRHIQSHVTKAW
jgi:Integrase zinc binding domain/Chromo (CHRromatin Organisation MOdifier) domain